MSKVLVISTSLRAKSNSGILAERLAAGAKASGHKVDLISLKVKTIGFWKWRAWVFVALCLLAGAGFPAANASAEEGRSMNCRKEENLEEGNAMKMWIGDTPVQVEWQNNESVDALRELARDGLTIPMSMYGGFEQVGSIGCSLPRNDQQTVTDSGDIVLYSGDQIVVFYGSNSWAYTRLGKITDKTADEMRALLSHGDVTLSITARE